MPDKIKIIHVTPGKKPKIRETATDIKSLHELVGGYFQAVCPWDDPVILVCNDEGKIEGMEPNRVLENEDGEALDVITGPFFLCGAGEEEFASVPEELIPKYEALFRFPEVFFRGADDHVYYMRTDGSGPKLLI